MVSHAGAKQIAVAEKLAMREHTLRNHLTTIYSKLQVRGRLEMHVFASAHGLGETACSRLTAEERSGPPGLEEHGDQRH